MGNARREGGETWTSVQGQAPERDEDLLEGVKASEEAKDSDSSDRTQDVEIAREQVCEAARGSDADAVEKQGGSGK